MLKNKSKVRLRLLYLLAPREKFLVRVELQVLNVNQVFGNSLICQNGCKCYAKTSLSKCHDLVVNTEEYNNIFQLHTASA